MEAKRRPYVAKEIAETSDGRTIFGVESPTKKIVAECDDRKMAMRIAKLLNGDQRA